MAIQALFLDFGNIFSTFDFRRFYTNVCQRTDLLITEQEFDAIAHKHYWPYDSGKITSAEYYQQFIKDAGVNIAQEAFEDCFLDIFLGDVHDLDVLLGKVREDIPLYLISNTNTVHYDRYIRNHPFLWDHIPEKRQVLSFQAKASKPDLKIYRHALGISGVLPHEGFFVDDLEKNIVAWQDLGGEGFIWHGGNHGIEALEEELQRHSILA